MTLDKAVAMIDRCNASEANKKIIKDYIPFMKAKPTNEKTIIRHMYCWRKLLDYAPDRDILKMSKDDIIILLSKVESQPLSQGTKAKIRLILKMIFKHYKGEDTFYPREVAWIKTTDKSETNVTPADLLTKSELNKLISNTLNLRDSAIIALLADAGLRPHELLMLKRKDCDLNSDPPHIFIPTGTKTGRRTTPILSSVPYLARYLDAIHNLEPDDPLFLHNLTDKTKGAMTYDALRMMLVKSAKRAGLTHKRIWLYLLRHTSVTGRSTKYSNQILRKMYGWEKGSRVLETTYVHLTSEDVDNEFLKVNGLKKKVEEEEKTIQLCPRCNYTNGINQKYCGRCGSAINITTILETEKKEATVKDAIAEALKDPKTLEEIVHSYLLMQAKKGKK